MSQGGRPTAEFVSEAQEIVDSLSRTLLELDAQVRDGENDPDVLNAAFRAVHSLKGLAALFGVGGITSLAHALESMLDALRLGKLALDQRALDVLFESVEQFAALLRSTAGGPEPDVSPLLARIATIAGGEQGGGKDISLAGIDDQILGVLTEYEEHRLRENLRQGRRIFRVHASFDLLAVDTGIDALKSRLKTFGEVITYLPSAESSADDRIDLDILLGSRHALAELGAGLAEDGVSVHDLVAGRETRAAEQTRPPVSSGALGVATWATAGTEPVREEHAGLHEEEEREAAPDLSLRSVSQTVRVDLARLDHLMNLIGELGVVQANLGGTVDAVRGHAPTGDVVRMLQSHLRTMERKLSLLQQGILDVRMVPLGQVFDKLARVVRKLGREADKDIRLVISGSDTELDKLIVEELSDPLMHMVRNCIDHGIEYAPQRAAAGKPATGRIDLRAFQRGNRVVIEVEDDGRGIDWHEIRDLAMRRSLIDPAAARELTAAQALDFIFVPGFTTRMEATALSGRGVGMDVVKTNISRLSGLIDIDTAPGRGTRFAITLPVTLAVIQALVIQAAGQTFCIPLNSVLESMMVQRADIATVEGHEVISLRGKTLPLVELARMFALSTRVVDDAGRVYVVVVGLAQHRVGLVVDELLGQQDVVIKPLGTALRSVPGIAGATELGGGRTVLLLDVGTLVEEAVARGEAAEVARA